MPTASDWGLYKDEDEFVKASLNWSATPRRQMSFAGS